MAIIDRTEISLITTDWLRKHMLHIYRPKISASFDAGPVLSY